MKVITRHQSNFLFLLFLILSFASPSFAQPRRASLGDQAQFVTELEVNGIKILVKRRENAPTVSAGLFIRGGARNLNGENAGIENLMLKAAVEGSRKFSRETVRRELARTGGAVSASSGNDYSAISLVSTRQNFDRTWEIFTDLATNPTFNAEDIERARAQISTGLREQETDADNFLAVLQERVIYANHPYANDVNGTLAGIVRFSAKDLNGYHKKIMETSRLLLVVVGDVDPKEIEQRVAATFGKLPRGDYKESVYPALDFSKGTLDVTPRALPTNYVRGVFNAPSLNSPDYYAMRVAIAILSSGINEEVRTKRQLSYAPSAELDSLSSNNGNIYVTAVDANQAVSVMLDEVNKIKNNQVDGDTIDRVAGSFLTLYFIGQETNVAQVGELAKYELIGGGWRNSFDFLDKIRQVTPEEVQAVSQKYMKNIRFIVIGDPKAIDRKIFLPNG